MKVLARGARFFSRFGATFSSKTLEIPRKMKVLARGARPFIRLLEQLFLATLGNP